MQKTEYHTYYVTAADDTGIRRVVAGHPDGMSLSDALFAKQEILHQRPRRLFNPRIKSCGIARRKKAKS